MSEPIENLTVRIELDKCCGILHVDGELDLATIDSVEKAISEVETNDAISHLVFDCQQLTFIDSTGIRALLSSHERWNGKVALAGPHRIVEKAISVAGLTDRLNATDSIEQAREILHHEAPNEWFPDRSMAGTSGQPKKKPNDNEV